MASLDNKGLKTLWNRIRSYINGRLEAISVPVDYIVEEGTDGIWTYRKWNSGIAECWGTHTGSYTHKATTVNSFYGYYEYVQLPFTFYGGVEFTFMGKVGSGWTMPGYLGYHSGTQTTIQFNLLAQQSGTQTVVVNFNVKGRWK